MISNYSNHAANERTFLAWIRTGLAVTSFGLLLAKIDTVSAFRFEIGQERKKLSTIYFDVLDKYDALALTILGVVIILLGTVHFIRTKREIDSNYESVGGNWHIGLFIASIISLLTTIFLLLVLFRLYPSNRSSRPAPLSASSAA